MGGRYSFAATPRDCPPLDEGLIAWLEGIFRDTLPAEIETTVDEIRFLQGQQSVLRRLRVEYDSQNDPDQD